MRARLSATHQQLVTAIAGNISNRLEAVVHDLSGSSNEHVSITLRERGQSIDIEVPLVAIVEATEDDVAREALRVRLKQRRDRMLFKAPPARLPKHIAPAHDPVFSRGGPPRGRR